MNLVAVSLGVFRIPDRDESRDGVDQRWARLLRVCGLLPLFVPNDPGTAKDLVETFKPSGLILTGGSNLVAYGGSDPERDETENLLLDWAETNNVPTLCVCRGMQLLQHRRGVSLETVSGHVATRHHVQFMGTARNVNSYHRLAARTAGRGLQTAAVAEDGWVEAVRDEVLPLHGVMWHPEREDPPAPLDVAFIRSVFAATAAT